MGDEQRAKGALELQARGREVLLREIPGYAAWSRRKLAEGVSEALIANLDAQAIYALPEAIEAMGEADFEELLSDL